MRALLHHPAILLLDEPMKSLDNQAQETLKRYLVETLVREQQATVLISTHGFDAIRDITDSKLRLDAGNLVHHAA